MKITKYIVSIVAASFMNTVLASEAISLSDIQHEWAEINYKTKEDKDKAFKKLITKAEWLVKQSPEKADSHIWLGIVQSSTAGAEGGLGALSYAKAARKNLEEALRLDENALQGSALTSLGVLYHKVPGWPIGFGSDKKAEQLLKRALVVNPEGIDPNYFYAEYLYDEGDYMQAKHFAAMALQAPAREDRPVADEGRRAELGQLISKINKKISD